MGCDIHAYREHKINGRWFSSDNWHEDASAYEEDSSKDLHMAVTWNNHTGSRNYAAFGLLASVRTEYDYSIEAKGMPDDVSHLVNGDYLRWDVDAHTPSYITKLEIIELRIRLKLVVQPPTEDSHSQDRYLDSLLKSLDDINGWIYMPEESEQRIVFWFDN